MLAQHSRCKCRQATTAAQEECGRLFHGNGAEKGTSDLDGVDAELRPAEQPAQKRLLGDCWVFFPVRRYTRKKEEPKLKVAGGNWRSPSET